ncbi:hypothetical protein SISSUDRAFT_1129218, partial [Sistotremastrum suecicum HHB10207 ss-3]
QGIASSWILLFLKPPPWPAKTTTTNSRVVIPSKAVIILPRARLRATASLNILSRHTRVLLVNTSLSLNLNRSTSSSLNRVEVVVVACRHVWQECVSAAARKRSAIVSSEEANIYDHVSAPFCENSFG